MSYTRSVDFVIAGSARRSDKMNRELDLIAAAFGDVDTAIDDVLALLALKANLASPAFTGVPTAPTAATGTNTTQIATTAYVIDAIGASGSLLPPQSGNAGKYLATNGTSAAWTALPYVPAIGNGGYQEVTADVTLGITTKFIDVTATTPGLTMTMPDATTFEAGDGYMVNWNENTDDGAQGVRDDDAELIYVKAVDERSFALVLTDASTAAGSWKRLSFSGNGLDAMPTKPVLRGEFSTFVAGAVWSAAVSIGSDAFLQVCHASGSLHAYVLSASGSVLSKGTSATTSEASAPVWSMLLSVTGGYVYIYLTSLTSGAIKAVGVTVSGTTASIGSPVTLIATATNTKERAIHAAVTGAYAVVLARTSTTTVEAVACSLTGTTVNAGSAITAISGTNMGTNATQVQICAYDTDKLLAVVLSDDGGAGTLFARHVANSSGTLSTPGSTTTDSVNDGDLACAVATTLTVVVCHREDGGDLYARVASISGSTVTLPAETSLFAAGGSAAGLALATVSSTLFALGVSATSGSGSGAYALTVSGTTIALGATLSAGSSGDGKYPPKYDGTYVFFGTSGLCTISASALAQVFAPSAIADAIGTTGPMNPAFRLSYAKSYAFFNQAGTARGEISRYGGVT